MNKNYLLKSYSEVNQKLFKVIETFLNKYSEYTIKIFFQYLSHRTCRFPKKQQLHKQIKLVACFYISD